MTQSGFLGALVQKVKAARYERNNKHYRWRSDNLDRFVFIHINKTGGTSVKQALKLPWEHQTALEKRQALGSVEWDKRFSFSFVRNPWDRVVSQYHFHAESRNARFEPGEISFNEWVRQTYGKRNPRVISRPKFFMPQLDWLRNEEGKVLVDAIYRFESLENDFTSICRRIGQKASLSHLRSSKRGPYRDYYEDEARELVKSWFSCDIDYFGYSF